MRRDPLTGDWIPMATARMNRPITAGPGATAKGNPLAARKPGDPYQDGEVPDTDYNVVVFENRFPSMVRVPGVSEDVTYVDGNPLWEKKLAAGRCEVICFDPNEDGLPADLPVSRLRTVVEAWAFRTAEISKMEGIEQIFPFENHGARRSASPSPTRTARSTATRSSPRRWRRNSSTPRPTTRRPVATCLRTS